MSPGVFGYIQLDGSWGLNNCGFITAGESVVVIDTDPLILLASAHAPRVGRLEPIGDHLCRRVDFVLGARAYGTWWEAHPHYLPVNANAGGLWTFEGSGTLWIAPSTSRPCRIAADVALPRLGDDTPGRGGVDWVYEWPVADGR